MRITAPAHDAGTSTTTARLRLGRTAVAATLTTLAAFGLSACDSTETPDVDVSSLSDQVQQGVDSATTSLEELKGSLDDADLDDSTRSAVEDAADAATSAVDQARTAAENADGDQAVEDARTALADAKAKLDGVAGDVDGGVKTALEALSRQIDTLSEQLDAK